MLTRWIHRVFQYLCRYAARKEFANVYATEARV
jgi:hypothetical protein